MEPREGKDEYISGEIKISYKYQSKETLMKEWNKIIAESKSQIDLNLSNHSIDEIKDNISSWIISIKDSDLFLDSLSALEKLFKWTEAKGNFYIFIILFIIYFIYYYYYYFIILFFYLLFILIIIIIIILLFIFFIFF